MTYYGSVMMLFRYIIVLKTLLLEPEENWDKHVENLIINTQYKQIRRGIKTNGIMYTNTLMQVEKLMEKKMLILINI